MTPGQRFARFATNVAVRMPVLWRLFRRPLTRNFDRLAASWNESRVTERFLAPLSAALAEVEPAPSRVLDLGTGSGAAARTAAARWPEAEVVGVDMSPQMIHEARAHAASPHESYEVGDASRLRFGDGEFELVILMNMIPFFDELARVTAAGGAIVVAFSRGPQTPIFVAPERLKAELGRRGFTHVADFSAGDGAALLARKADRP